MRGATAGYFDAVDAHAWSPVPVDPAAEGIVEREAVAEYQGTAGTARSQAAQGHPLCGRICGATGGAPEKTESRYLPKYVVDSEGGRRFQILG